MGVASDLVAGTASGSAASLAGQPLDTVRVRLQSRGHLYSGALDAAAKTLRADGLRGFFRGAVPPLLGMGPKNAIGFTAHGVALRLLEGGGERPTIELKRNAAMGNIALAGCAAGLAQCAVVVPSDRIKCQLQVQGLAAANNSASAAAGAAARVGALRECLRVLVRRDGLAVGLLRGWWPTVWRQTLSAPIYFGSYELLRRASARAAGTATATASPPLSPTPPRPRPPAWHA